MRKFVFVFPLRGLVYTGCSSLQKHGHARCGIVALDSSTQAHVCMSPSEVDKGDQLFLFQSVCAKRQIPGGKYSDYADQTTCTKVSKGSVEVMENSDPHFIKVKALSGATFKEGDIVEKSSE